MAFDRKEYEKKWREQNRQYLREYQKKWRVENPERLRQNRKKYYQNNIEICKARSEKQREETPERVAQNKRKWYENNQEKVKQNRKKWKEENPIKFRISKLKREKHYRISLYDSYLRKIIMNKYGLKSSEVTPQLLQATKLGMLLFRSQKENYKNLNVEEVRNLFNNLIKGVKDVA